MTVEAALATTTWWALLLLLGVNPTFWVLIAVLRFGHDRLARCRRRKGPWVAREGKLRPSDVAILIPAHNEEVCIAATLDSAARLLPPENIHVIADGCTDRTAEIARDYGTNVLELNPSRGKAGGIEAAVEHFGFAERFAVMLVTDADTELAPDYLKHGLPLLDEPGTAALAGYAYSSWQPQNLSTVGRFLIAYRTRLYAVMQFLKYGQTWRYTNVAPIVPGFASMYRTTILPQMDLNPPGLVIEDFNMTFELHRKRLGRIVFGIRSSATAQDPDNLRDYYKQITRWSLGFWQTLRRHGFWWSGFSLALAVFLVEVLVASTVMVAMAAGAVLAALAPALTGAPEWIVDPATFAASVLHPVRVLLFVAIPDYLLTILVAAWMRRPSLLVYGVGFLFIRIIDSTSTFWALFKLVRTRSNGRWSSPARRVVEPAASPGGPGTAAATLIEAVEPGIVDEVELPSRTRQAVRRAAPIVRDALLVLGLGLGTTLLVVLVAVPIPAVMAACVLGLVLLAAAGGRRPRPSGSVRTELRALLVRYLRKPRTVTAPEPVTAGPAATPAVAGPPSGRPAPRPRTVRPDRPLPRRRPTFVVDPAPPLASPSAPQPVQDIVIIGGGVAGASVLARLAAGPSVPAGLHITLLDRTGETGGGAAYYDGVHPALLLNDPVARIDRTGLGFGRWLADHGERLDAELEALAADDPRVAQWRAAHGDALLAGEVAPLFVLRRWFGAFIRERVGAARATLDDAATTVTVRTATATDVRAHDDGWLVALDGGETVTARTVVLATGGPQAAPAPAVPGYLRGTPGLDLDAVERALLDRPGSELLIIGSAASAVEMVYCLESHPELRHAVGRVVVVSTGGRLPDGLPSSAPGLFTPGPALRRAQDADGLMQALAEEVATARRLAFTIPDVYPVLHAEFLAAFSALAPAEKKRLVDVHGRRYLTLLRKTSTVYGRAARRMERRGALQLVAGRVIAVEAYRRGGGVTAVLEDGSSRTADVVLDCRGFDSPTADPLVRGMVENGYVTVNDSGRGLLVGRGFEAAPGLTVLGPLLAGTVQDEEYIWHLEDIPRIYAYADRVVEALLGRLADAPVDQNAGQVTDGERVPS